RGAGRREGRRDRPGAVAGLARSGAGAPAAAFQHEPASRAEVPVDAAGDRSQPATLDFDDPPAARGEVEIVVGGAVRGLFGLHCAGGLRIHWTPDFTRDFTRLPMNAETI